MDFNSSRQCEARKAYGKPEDSILVHKTKVEIFNLENRRHRALHHRAFVASVGLGLFHSTVAIGLALGCGASRTSGTIEGSPSTGGDAAGHEAMVSLRSPNKPSCVSRVQHLFHLPFSDIGPLPLLFGGTLGGCGLGLVVLICSTSERLLYDLEYQRELWEIDNHIEGERTEMIEIYQALGLDEGDSEVITDMFSKYPPSVFAQLMMVEELGYARLPPLTPVKTLLHLVIPAAIGYTLSFTAPLLPFFISLPMSSGMEALARKTLGRGGPVVAAAASSAVLLAGFCIGEGMSRTTVFFGSYASRRTRVIGAISSLCLASLLFSLSFCLGKKASSL